MHEGVEVRGNSLRVYFRYQGELCREPFPGDASPANIEQASRLAGLIRHEIKHGTFSYARHFPRALENPLIRGPSAFLVDPSKTGNLGNPDSEALESLL